MKLTPHGSNRIGIILKVLTFWIPKGWAIQTKFWVMQFTPKLMECDILTNLAHNWGERKSLGTTFTLVYLWLIFGKRGVNWSWEKCTRGCVSMQGTNWRNPFSVLVLFFHPSLPKIGKIHSLYWNCTFYKHLKKTVLNHVFYKSHEKNLVIEPVTMVTKEKIFES